MKLETMEKTATGDERRADRKALIGHVEVTCEAVLGSGTLTIAQLEKLAAGDVVPLDRSPADPVEVRINGKIIARGEIVTLDNRFAVRLTEVG
jgi:flagellar motor switch protein FliN